MRPSHHSLLRQTGVGMIEVLVLVLLMSVGMFALAKIQGMIMKDGGTAHNRAIAMSLAQEKLDDLRGFKCPRNGYGGCTVATAEFDYYSIDNNAGGNLASGNITVGNTTFNRTWAVISYYYCMPGAAAQTTNCTQPKDFPDYKTVTVTVSWSDQAGSPSLSLVGTIFANNAMNQAAASAPLANRPGPTITHTPGATPDVVPIWTAGTVKREASKPRPDTTQHGVSTVTTFDVMNYRSTDNGALSMESLATLNCTCVQASVGDAMTPSVDANNLGVTVQKRRGTVKTGGQYNEQPALCSVCCQDHHDITGYRRYDPFRTDDSTNFPGSLNGDHSHAFNLTAAEAVGSDYDEACKLRRINGLWRAVPDWQLEALIVQTKSYFDNNLSTYQSAVADAVKAYVSSIDTAAYPYSRPTLSVNLGSNAHDPSTQLISISGTTTSNPLILLARGIYIDHLTTEQINALKTKIAANDPSVLSEIPFYEVNLTRLATWSSSDTNVATVRSDAITNATETSYVRGYVVKGSSGGNSNITATVKRSNTGLTDSRAIDAHDALPHSGIVRVSTTGGTPIVTRYIYGQFISSISAIGSSAITVPPTVNGLSCSKYARNVTLPPTGANCNARDGCYSCSTNNETWSDFMEITVVTTNLQYLPGGGTGGYKVCPAPNGGLSPYYTVATASLPGNKTEYRTTFRFASDLSSGDVNMPIRFIDSTGTCP